jgi:rRNA maturation RNase YbeY
MRSIAAKKMSELAFRNRQRVERLDLVLLRQITREILAIVPAAGHVEPVQAHELAVFLVASNEMATLNERHLGHRGSTDVITFDYGGDSPGFLRGDIFVCIDDAITQAKRFRTTWQSELVRYLIHGLLHLRGLDDLDPAARRIMKRAENRLLKQVSRRFDLTKLSAPKGRRSIPAMKQPHSVAAEATRRTARTIPGIRLLTSAAAGTRKTPR